MRYAAAILILSAAAASAFAPSEPAARLAPTPRLPADQISKHTAKALLGARGGFTVRLDMP